MSLVCTYINFLALTAHMQAARLNVNKGWLADNEAAKVYMPCNADLSRCDASQVTEQKLAIGGCTQDRRWW